MPSSSTPPKTRTAGRVTGMQGGWLTGQFLIAMPGMADARFARAVIFVCQHDEQGAMGLIVNRLFGQLDFNALLSQLDIAPREDGPEVRVHFGGPVESGRGFVLHTADYEQEGTLKISENVSMTATVDILKAIADGRGPRRCLLALGYAGWAPYQLDQEIQANGWLTSPADVNLIFDDDIDGKWNRALSNMGINAGMLAGEAGHA